MSYSGSKETDGKRISAPTSCAEDNENEKYGLIPALERFYTSKEYAINFCIFLHAKNMYHMFITVDQASEVAIIMARYFAKTFATKSWSSSQPKMDVSNNETKKAASSTDAKAKQRIPAEVKSIEGLKAVLAEKGYKLNNEETNDLMVAFDEFSRYYARKAWVILGSENDDWEVVKITDGKGMVDKGKGKEAGSGVKGKEEMDGHSWAKRYLPPGGFWAC